MRLIDADALKDEIAVLLERNPNLIDDWLAYAVEDTIDDAPTISPKTGRWLTTDAYPHRVYCSECYKTFAQAHWEIWEDGSLPRAYCPNCGARMEEVEG